LSGRLVVVLTVALGLALAACGKKGGLDAPPGADPARSRDVFDKPR
jgi:predicted small lipoprotein YifL